MTCLLPGLIGATILFVNDYREGQAQLEHDTLQTARALVQAVDAYLMNARLLGESLATDESLARNDMKQFRQRVQDAITRTGVGSNIILVNGSGQQVFNLYQEPGQPLPDSPNPAAIRRVFESGQAVVSDLTMGPLVKKPVIAVHVPVFAQGKVVYVLSVGILASQFSAILRAQDFPSHWLVGIVDSSGQIVARTRGEEQFVGRKAASEYIKGVARASEGSMDATSREGIAVRSIYSRSRATNWSVGIGIPRDILEAGLRKRLWQLAAGVTALFLAGLALAWSIGGRIARSVQSLSASEADPSIGGNQGPADRWYIKEVAEAAALLEERSAALRRANRDLLARESELHEAHRLAKFGSWYWDRITDEITISDSIKEMFGQEAMPFAQQRGTILSVETWEEMNAAIQECVRTGTGYDLELPVNHGNGSIIWVNTKCQPVRDPSGEVIALRGTTQDITERRKAQDALETSRRTHMRKLEEQVAERTAALQAARDHLEERVAERTEQVRRLVAETTSAEERERQALARDLHDDLGQILHVARIKLGLLVREELSDRKRSLAEETSALITNASRQVRSLTSQLSPPILSTLGLPAALRWLCDEMQQTYGLAIQEQIDAGQFRLSLAQSTILFRAARELLINVAKHSSSNNASLEFLCAGDTLSLTVADGGNGIPAFDEALDGTQGFGLASIRERLSFMGGTMNIQTVTGGGVRVVLKMPLETEMETAEIN